MSTRNTDASTIVGVDGAEWGVSHICHGTERDYLLWRLNRNYRSENPGMADYVGVRKAGQWEVAA